jgi:hypothetical protein
VPAALGPLTRPPKPQLRVGGTPRRRLRYTEAVARPRSIQNGVIAVVIFVELIVLIGHPLFGWGPSHHRFAATPPTLAITPATPPSAAATLLELSAVARRQARAGAPAPGAFAYVQREQWQLADQRVGGRRVDHPLPRLISTWRAADGAGRALIVARTRRGEATTATALPAGGVRVPALTGSAATLDHRLGLHRGVSTQTALAAFAGLAAEEPIPAGAESEILRLLAGDAGLTNAGTTRDRNGRPGIAIQFTNAAARTVVGPGLAVRDTLVLDPRTGALLEFDTALAGPPGHLNVQSGALLSYVVYLRSSRVARPGERPTTSG